MSRRNDNHHARPLRRDNYARREPERRKAYEAAYESPEAKEWIRSLTPAQRVRAEELGLLKPRHDPMPDYRSVEALPDSLEPREDGSYDDGLFAKPLLERMEAARTHPAWKSLLGEDASTRTEALRAFLMSTGNPKRTWACLRCLAGSETCTALAKELGMSKQTFHYHVRQLAKRIGLPMPED